MSEPGKSPRGLRHPFWQAAVLLVVSYLLIRFGIASIPPLFGSESAPVPASVVLQFMVTALVGVPAFAMLLRRWTS